METRQSKTEIVKHSSPKYHRFPALWDSKQITRISLRAKPSSVSRRFLAVPWPRPSSPLVFKPARLIPSLICLHLGKEENKVPPPPSPVCYISEKKRLENVDSTGKSVCWRLLQVGPTFSFRLTNVFGAFSAPRALGGPLKSQWRPPCLTCPPAAAHISAFQLHGGARSN